MQEAALFGLLQGVTEFLPVSSSGHLLLLSRLFLSLREGGFFLNLAVHGATLLSILIIFRKDLPPVLKNKDLLLKTAVALLPLLISGLFLRDFVARLLQDPAGAAGEGAVAAASGAGAAAGLLQTRITALGFLVTGALLLALPLKQRLKKNRRKEAGKAIESPEKTSGLKESDEDSKNKSGLKNRIFPQNPQALVSELTYGKALGVGAAQALCVLPGFSRSGVTIAAGIFLGLRPQTAAFFSFLIALPAVAGALAGEGVLQISSEGKAALPLLRTAAPAFLAAFLSGLLSLAALLKILSLNKLPLFGLYLVPLGLACLIF